MALIFAIMYLCSIFIFILFLSNPYFFIISNLILINQMKRSKIPAYSNVMLLLRRALWKDLALAKFASDVCVYENS